MHQFKDLLARFVLSAAVVFLACVVFAGPAQAYTGRELQLWTQAGVRAGLTDKLQLGLDQHARFYENFPEVARWYTDLELAYDLPRHFEVGVGYRFMVRADKDPSCCRHRFNGDVKYTLDAADLFRFGARLRGQGTLLDDKAMRFVVRGQLEMMLIRYKVARPFIATELFGRVVDTGEVLTFETLRFDAGVSIRIIKGWRVEPMYRFEIPATRNDRLVHIIGLSTRYSFK